MMGKKEHTTEELSPRDFAVQNTGSSNHDNEEDQTIQDIVLDFFFKQAQTIQQYEVGM